MSTNSQKTSGISVIHIHPAKTDPPDDDDAINGVDFERAIAKTGFGQFNMFTIFVGTIAGISSMSETTAMSLILPRAHCDLNLTLSDKGALNGVVYIGMVLSAIMWGFLSDILGRQKILKYGCMCNALSNIIGGLSQNFWALAVSKFCSGFIAAGPFAVLMSYMSEVTAVQYRSRIMILLGCSFSMSNIILPAIAWLVLPNDWDFEIIRDYFMIHSWHIFLLILTLPSLLSGVLSHFLPESPKFLMSRGRNSDALEVFQEIYRRNHNPGEFPIKSLADEKYVRPKKSPPNSSPTTVHKTSNHNAIVQLPVESRNTSSSDQLESQINDEEEDIKKSHWIVVKEGIAQMMTIFQRQYIRNCLLVFTIQFGFLWSQNTLRLWMPSLLSMVSDYEISHQDTTHQFDLCQVIVSNSELPSSYAVSSWNNTMNTPEPTIISSSVCSQVVDPSIYLNSITVGVVGLIGFAIAGTIINILGHRNLLFGTAILSGIIATCIYKSSSRNILVGLFSLFLTMGSISGTSIIGLSVTLVPTQLRTMTVSILMMYGRCGAMLGNFLFPWMLSLGCLPPFLSIAIILFVCGLLCLALPKSAQIPLA